LTVPILVGTSNEKEDEVVMVDAEATELVANQDVMRLG
jgi:hypothetical protein